MHENFVGLIAASFSSQAIAVKADFGVRRPDAALTNYELLQ
jgi:hypothetical protein